MNQQQQSVPEFRDAEPPDPLAIQQLKRSTTVAFFPPDSCLDRRAAPTGTHRDEQVVRLQCGTVMTDLEKAAIAAGFQVVSWQSLRGTEQPIEYAKQKSVDLLFEINELDTVDVADRDDRQTLAFFEHRGLNDDGQVVVGRDTAERCRRTMAASVRAVGLAASLDVKMVAVGSGRVLWSYRNTRTKDASRAAGVQLYPARQPSRKWAWAAIVVGGLVIGGSAQGGSSQALAVGVGLAGAGVLGLVLRGHESPDRVLCNRPAVADPFLPAAAPAPIAVDPGSATYEYSSKTRRRDPLDELRLALVQEIVADFTTQLRKARGPQ